MRASSVGSSESAFILSSSCASAVIESDPDSYRLCMRQNDAPQFVNELTALPRFAKSKLLQGIERALQLEIYDAAELLFSCPSCRRERIVES
jgi:hypothetical protein